MPKDLLQEAVLASTGVPPEALEGLRLAPSRPLLHSLAVTGSWSVMIYVGKRGLKVYYRSCWGCDRRQEEQGRQGAGTRGGGGKASR